MRKSVCSLALLAGLVAPLALASAQATSGGGNFGVGSKFLSVGLLGGGTGYGIGAGAAFEVGIKQFTPELSLGVGGSVGFTTKSYDFGFLSAGDEYTLRSVPIAAIANLHYKLANQPKVDLYGGLNLGFVSYSYSSDVAGFESSSVGGSSDLALGLNVGARYDFAPRVAGMLQLSGGSHFPLYFVGLTFRM